MKIIQQRITIFVKHNLMYLPEIANKIQLGLLPQSLIMGAVLNNSGISIQNVLNPQWGMPWFLNQEDESKRLTVAFLNDRIEIISNQNMDYNHDLEIDFISKSIDILSWLKKEYNIDHYSRVAFAPNFAFIQNEQPNDIENIWHNVLNKDLDPLNAKEKLVRIVENINWEYNQQSYSINNVLQIEDGFRSVKKDDNQIFSEDACLLQFDFNTSQNINCDFGVEQIERFIKIAQKKIGNSIESLLK